MEIVREILFLLIKRKRESERALRSAGRAPAEPVSFWNNQDLPYKYGKRDEAATICEIARTMYAVSKGSSPQTDAERKRIISITDRREEFVTLADGYAHLWPQGSPNGAWSAWHLRVLADELDRRNRTWDARVRKALSADQRDDS
jgi:hypothetical protein